jgi:hypothetical protein
MIGVCIATGDWHPIGVMAAERMQRMTGLECRVISDVGGEFQNHIAYALTKTKHASWLKCGVAGMYSGYDSFLLFDSDIICLRPWSPQRIFEDLGRPFCAVPDDNHENVLQACKRNGLPFPGTYVNFGMTIFGREHKFLWDRIWAHHETWNQPWWEQSAGNMELFKAEQAGEIEVVRLPKRYNRLNHGGAIWHPGRQPKGTVNMHLASLNDAPRVAKEQKIWMDASA